MVPYLIARTIFLFLATARSSAFCLLAPTKTIQEPRATILFHRPLTAFLDESSETTITFDELIQNVKVTELDDPDSILHMPVLGESDVSPVPRISNNNMYYPMANLMQGSAGYIAEHAGSIAVFQMTGEPTDSVLRDITLCHILGLKIVLVLSTTNDNDHLPTAEATLGYLRTEVERKLNRYLCSQHHQANTKANVVSGNSFVIAKKHSPDSYHGKATSVSTTKLHDILQQHDIVLLTNIILDQCADHYIYCQGCQLASQVAVALQASKLLLVRSSTPPKLLTYQQSHVQDIPLSMALEMLQYHYGTDDDSFWHDLQWAAYAVQKGVCRAHLVNGSLDGALLEELFTAQNGANTCLYHDDEFLMDGE